MQLLLALFVLSSPGTAAAEIQGQNRNDGIINQQMQDLDFTQVEKTVDEINRETNGYLPSLNWRQLLDDLRSGK